MSNFNTFCSNSNRIGCSQWEDLLMPPEEKLFPLIAAVATIAALFFATTAFLINSELLVTAAVVCLVLTAVCLAVSLKIKFKLSFQPTFSVLSSRTQGFSSYVPTRVGSGMQMGWGNPIPVRRSNR